MGTQHGRRNCPSTGAIATGIPCWRNLAADETGRHSPRPGFRDLGIQFVFRMPSVSRRHCSRPKRSWRRSARSRQTARVFQPPGICGSDRRRLRDALARFQRTRGRTFNCLHRPQHSGVDGEHLRLRRQLEEVESWSPRAGCHQRRAGLSEPQRSARPAVAGARYSRLPARSEGAESGERGRAGSRSASSPTTWKCCTTSTSKRSNFAIRSACRWCEPRQSACIPSSSP
jgi:hypothetical protein